MRWSGIRWSGIRWSGIQWSGKIRIATILIASWLLFPVMTTPGASGSATRRGAGQPVDLLLTGGAVVTMNNHRQLHNPGYVAIRGNRIVAVGPMAELRSADFRPVRVIDFKGRVVMPGLINAHTHLAMTLLRGVGDDLNLDDWLKRYIFPAEAGNVTSDYVATGTRLGLIEMIRGGITTFADMYYFEETVAEVTRQAGVRAILGETLLDFPAPDNKTWDQAIGYAQKFILRWKGDPLITPALAPHALYTVNRTHLEAVRDLAKQLDVPILTHLAEARSETQYAHQNFGLTPTGYLDQVGLLSARTLLAHVIHVDQQDLALLNQRDVGIVHCPQSNMKLASGTAPVPAMLKNGMRVGLGTDGAASNNDLNLWEEIDTAAKLHKLITGDPTVVTAEEALALATIGGARALHLEDRLGSLEPGKLADLIVVGMSAPHQSPVYNLYSHLVYATKAGDVSDVMVNGRWLMRDRRLLTLKEPAVMNDVRRYQRQIRRGLNDVLNAPTGR